MCWCKLPNKAKPAVPPEGVYAAMRGAVVAVAEGSAARIPGPGLPCSVNTPRANRRVVLWDDDRVQRRAAARAGADAANVLKGAPRDDARCAWILARHVLAAGGGWRWKPTDGGGPAGGSGDDAGGSDPTLGRAEPDERWCGLPAACGRAPRNGKQTAGAAWPRHAVLWALVRAAAEGGRYLTPDAAIAVALAAGAACRATQGARIALVANVVRHVACLISDGQAETIEANELEARRRPVRARAASRAKAAASCGHYGVEAGEVGGREAGPGDPATTEPEQDGPEDFDYDPWAEEPGEEGGGGAHAGAPERQAE